MRRTSHFTLLALAIVVKFASIFFFLTVFRSTSWFGHITTDIWAWRDFFNQTSNGQIPYVDFAREYPPGAGLFYWLMAGIWPQHTGFEGMLWTHALILGIFDLINAILFFKIVKMVAPNRAILLTTVFFLFPTNLILSPFRFEAVCLLFVLAGYFYRLKGRTLWATALWTIGTQIKWFPIAFIGVQELVIFFGQKNRRHWLKALAVFAGITAILNLPFWIACQITNGNSNNFLATYLFHIHRPLYWDTLLGIGTMWLGPLPWERWAGAWSLALMALAFVVKPRMKFEYKAVFVIMAAFLFNRIYSTQFNLWFYPFLLFGIAQETDKRFLPLLLLTVTLDVCNATVFPFAFAAASTELKNFEPYVALASAGFGTWIFTVTVILRALLLLLFSVLLLRSTRRSLV